MVRSMTGFSSARVDTPRGPLNIEIRSVNSRFLDMQIRLPDELKSFESGMRELLGLSLSRGKIEFRAAFSRSETAEMPSLNPAVLVNIKYLISTVQAEVPGLAMPTVFDVLQWPGLLNENEVSLDSIKQPFFAGIKLALDELVVSRSREGTRLSADIQQKIDGMNTLLSQLEVIVPVINREYHQRISSKLHELFRQAFPNGLQRVSGAELSERILQESNLFSMRVDVSEELSRLRSHLTEMAALLNSEKPAGRKLDFLTQELHREANTLGAKSPSIELTRASIELKLLNEQIREQVQNLE